MTEDQLIAFERIVREGSFSRGAWALGIAQPTITARIQLLESEVGGPLFVRGRRQLTLSDRGVAFLPYARKILSTLAEGIEAAQRAQRGEQGRVTIGILGSMTGGFLAPALHQFHRLYPAVECHIEDGSHQQIIQWMLDGVVEVGVIAWPRTDMYATEMIPLLQFHEPVVLLAAKQHPLAQISAAQDGVTQADLARLGNPFVLIRWWQITPDSITQIANRAAVVLDLPMATGHYLVMQGSGVGFFNRTQIETDLATGTLVEIPVRDLPPVYRDSALVRPATQSMPLAAPMQNLVDCLRQQAQRLQLLA